MADGHLGKCKDCTKQDSIENRNSKLEYYREYDRKRSDNPDRIEMRKEYSKTLSPEYTNEIKRAYIKRNPEKRKAHQAVSNAIRDGKLIRESCEKCGNDDSEAHHDDYSKPLDIRWLCKKHHMEFHRIINENMRKNKE